MTEVLSKSLATTLARIGEERSRLAKLRAASADVERRLLEGRNARAEALAHGADVSTLTKLRSAHGALVAEQEDYTAAIATTEARIEALVAERRRQAIEDGAALVEALYRTADERITAVRNIADPTVDELEEAALALRAAHSASHDFSAIAPQDTRFRRTWDATARFGSAHEKVPSFRPSVPKPTCPQPWRELLALAQADSEPQVA